MSKARYSVETRWGGSESAPTKSRLAEIIAELNTKDEEHPDTWLIHEASGYLLRLDEDGYAYLEDPDLQTISHMKGIGHAAALDLWLRFASEGPPAVASELWVHGPRVFSEEERHAQRVRAAQLTLESDKKFFLLLGTEDASQQCRKVGCPRGRVKLSVYCAAHHFEQVMGRPCPFLK